MSAGEKSSFCCKATIIMQSCRVHLKLHLMKQPLVLRITRAFYNYAFTTDFHKFTLHIFIRRHFYSNDFKCIHSGYTFIVSMSVLSVINAHVHHNLNSQMSNREFLINLLTDFRMWCVLVCILKGAGCNITS